VSQRIARRICDCHPNHALVVEHHLFAALNVATGKVTARCRSRHRHEEFLMFLRQVARTYPGVELHLAMDN
jgi:hypothetical protein